MSILEIVAVLLGFANILLLVRRSIWNYPFGIAMVLLYAWIFRQAHLYSDALLQFFFLALNLYGWINWARTRTRDSADGAIPVRWIGTPKRMLTLLGVLVATLVWGTIMQRHTDASHPYWDGTVAMMSIAAQALLARRFIDNWIGWIIVDLTAVPLYWVKGLHLTAGLYVVFLILSLVGLRGWIRAEKTGRVAIL